MGPVGDFLDTCILTIDFFAKKMPVNIPVPRVAGPDLDLIMAGQPGPPCKVPP